MIDKINESLREYDQLVTPDQRKFIGKDLIKDELTIDDLHRDLEKRLAEEGFIFDKRKFIFAGKHLGVSERIADSVARFVGSWPFILLFLFFLSFWIVLNIYLTDNSKIDPFPFILLNLVLSCIAAIQAPMILMSQNRQSQMDKKQEEIDIEKDIVDFKQNKLDLILDQKEWIVLRDIHERIKRIEDSLKKRKAGK